MKKGLKEEGTNDEQNEQRDNKHILLKSGLLSHHKMYLSLLWPSKMTFQQL